MKKIAKNKLVLVLIICIIALSSISITSVKAQGSKFIDIESTGWYFEPVIQLYGMNIIDGYPDNTFKPDGNVKTDELIKMIIKALGFDIQ
ncbi:MAG: S-layer homology domain-containing protein, partial [Clostridia bacterium]|nr:S-layer homology domain-containing protein [Clostridia bacterium]MDD3972867.1 S-layer homology domain-containing protein [Clostridia bacterium]